MIGAGAAAGAGAAIYSDTTVDFNADLSGYNAPLSAALELTERYAQAASGLVGVLAKVDAAMISGIRRTNGMSGANKTAVSVAADYQHQLEGIAATTAVVGKGQSALSKTTMQLARDFPIGMGKAVDTVRALQESSVTSVKAIKQLGTESVKLQAATGFGADLSRDMLQLNRQLGNGTQQFGKLNDSLVTTTKLWGANAGATVQFAKAIAPVAASVGMSETKVLGLSAAMSRLGEDGFAGATAVNKVLLDMSRSIRTGSPELREYASLLGTSADELERMFKADPTATLTKFVKSVGRQGAGSQRALDALGLDGVRTTRAISALSSSGDLDKVIQTSVDSYGSGSTDKAAHAALHGVTNEMTRLQESMQQTVANGGKPFLGLLGAILTGANKVSGALAAVSGSDVFQALASGTVAAGVAGTVAMKSFSALSTMSLAERGARAVGRLPVFQNFREARNVPIGPLPADAGLGGMLGQRFSQKYGQDATIGRVTQSAAARIRNGAVNWAALGVEQIANDFRTVRGDAPRVTPSGTALRAGVGDAWRDFKAAPTLGNLGTQATAAGRALGTFTKETSAAAGAWGRLGRATLAAGGSALSYGAGSVGIAGRMAGRGMARVNDAMGAFGLSPMTAGVAAAAVGGMYIWGQERRAREMNKDMASAASENVFGAYNDFAESIGAAGKGLVSFGAAVQKLTQSVAGSARTIEGALSLDSATTAAALAPGYKASFKLAGDKSKATPKGAATQIGLLLGSDPDPAMLSKALQDVVSQRGTEFAKRVSEQLQETYGAGGSGEIDYRAGISEVSRQQRQKFLSGLRTSESAQQVAGTLTQSAEQRVQRIQGVYGDKAGTVASLSEAKKFFEAMQAEMKAGKLRPGGREYGMTLTTLAQLLGTDEKTLRAGGMDSDVKGITWEEFVAEQQRKKPGQNFLGNLRTAQAQGVNLDSPDFTSMAGVPYGQQSLDKAAEAFYDLAQSGGSAAKSLYAVNERAREFGTTTSKLTDAQKKGLSSTALAFGELQQRPDDRRAAQRAGSALSADLVDSNKNASLASLDLSSLLENVAQIDTRRAGVVAAQQYLAQQKQAEDAQLTNAQLWMRDRQAGGIARAMGPQQDEMAEQGRQNAISGQQQSALSELSFAKQFIEAATNTQRQVKRMEEDSATARMRATRDFNRQRSWAEQDYQRQTSWSVADFQRQQRYTEEDYLKGRKRAYRDFYQSQAWAADDFNTSMRRAAEDHATQLKRAQADAAKSFYDPYQRRQAQSVWDAQGLLGNMADQRQAMDRQLANVKKLQGMGMSQAVIDNLGLMEAGNAQQVDRLLADMMSDPSLIAKINAEIAKRGKSAGAMTNTDLNENFRRGEEDFRKSLSRMQEDFTKSVNRARKQFDTQMADLAKDSATARERAQKQFDLQMSRNAEQFAVQMRRSAIQFNTSLSDMAADLKRSEARAFEDLARFGEQLSGNIVDTKNRFLKAMAQLPAGARAQLNSNLKALIKDMHTNFVSEFNKAFAGEGITAGNISGGQISPPNAGGDQGPSKSASNNSNVNLGKQMAAAYGWGSGAQWNALYNLWQRESGWRNTAQNPTSTAFGIAQFLDSTWKTVGATKTSDPKGQIAAGLKYVKQRYGNPLKAWNFWNSHNPHWYGDGAVFSSGPRVIGVGERGPEAVIPLNHRGVDVLAAAFSKWATPLDAARARMSAYASQAAAGSGASYTYDQRTQYTGDVVVQANDAATLERQLRAKQRRTRALQPMGSR